MRDILLAVGIFGSLPFILRNPFIGILMWIWISVMNPHRLSWGFAHDFQFAMIVAAVTLVAIPFTKQPRRFPLNSATVCMLLFVALMNVTTLFAIYPSEQYEMWSKVMKIDLMIFAAMLLTHTRDQLQKLIWVLAGSVAFYGVKGGIFAVLTGGNYRVWGPPGTFIEGNNEVALALVIVLPLLRYLQLTTENKWVRRGLVLTMLLSSLAVLSSYSRGAFLAIGAILLFLWLKTKQKVTTGIALILIGAIGLTFMPDKYFERIATILEYKADASALGRLNAWWMTWNLAADRPLTGGGFVIYEPAVFAQYAPNPTDIHAAHSIYFQVLGEHGWIGFILFVLIWIRTWALAGRIAKAAGDDPQRRWARDLGAMVQVSLIGYAVGGAFLSLAYFDVPYYLVGIVSCAWGLVKSGDSTTASMEPQRRRRDSFVRGPEPRQSLGMER